MVTGSGSDGRKYEIRLANNETKDAEATKTVGDAGEKGKENRRDAGGIRDNARSTGNALAPAANTPEGMRRLAGSMDERLAGCDSLIWPRVDGWEWLHLCGRGCAVVTV